MKATAKHIGVRKRSALPSNQATHRQDVPEPCPFQANLNAIIENSSATIYSLDRQFRYINFNSLLKETLKKVYGIEIRPGDIVFDFLYNNDPAEAEDWRLIYTRALEGESIQFVKEFLVGSHHSFSKFYINPIKQESQVTGLSCLAIDITKEKISELAIASNESRFRKLIENSLDTILVRNEHRDLIYVSPSLGRMLGYNKLEMESLKVEIFVHEADASKLEKLYEQASNHPGVPMPSTLRLKHKTGRFIWVEGVTTNMVADEDVRGFVSNFRDITQRMEMDLENEMISKDLVKRNENLEQYAYIVSHNLRAPIANLLGLANLLEMPTLGQQDRDNALSHVISSARKLDEVIRDLSSILQTKEEIVQHREIVRFQEMVDNVTSNIETTIVKDDVSIFTDFSQCNGALSIKSYMHSIFYNLISNSIKYRRSRIRPAIRIRSFQKDGHISLVFEDNGLGMDLPAYGEKVFGLYRRFHPYQAEGKGMGLFMVKSQVENLGGKISVQSEVGKGTIFTIEL